MATLAKTTRSNPITLSASGTGPYLIGFRLFDTDSLEVYVDNSPRTDWSIAANFVDGYDDNATITFDNELNSGNVILIYGDMASDRERNFVAGDGNMTAELNVELARHAAMLQEVQRNLSRTLRVVPEGLAVLQPGANKFLRTDANGQIYLADLESAPAPIAESHPAIQSEMDFWDWQYITDAQELAYIRANDTASQNETTVTAGVRAMFEAAMTWVRGGVDRVAAIHCRGKFARNNSMLSAAFLDDLWTLTGDPDWRFLGEADFVAKDWLNATAVNSYGYWAEQSITDAVPQAMFPWEQSAKSTFAPRGNTWRFFGEADIDTDPIGIRLRNVNVFNLGFYVDKFAQGNWHVSGVNNTEGIVEGTASRGGAQITNCGGTGFLPSDVYVEATPGSGITTLVLKNSDNSAYTGSFAFTTDQVGREVGIADDPVDFMANIQSYTSATEVVLDDEISGTVSAAKFSFTNLTISTTASSTAASVPTDLDFDLTGRYIGIINAQSTLHSELGSPYVRVTDHNTTTGAITLARAVAKTVADTACVVGPNVFWGKDEDQVDTDGVTPEGGHNNDTRLCLRIESGSEGYPAVSAYLQNILATQFIGTKFHGVPSSVSNFGANFTMAVFDNCKSAQMIACQYEYGGYSATYAKMLITGSRTYINSCASHFGDSRPTDKLALIYTDPLAAGDANCVVEMTGGGTINYAGFPSDDQALTRHGANGAATNVRGRLIARGSGKYVNFDRHIFIPTISFGGDEISTDGGVYANQNGFYYRDGDLYRVYGSVEVSNKGSGVGDASLDLPIALDPRNYNAGIHIGFSGGASSVTNTPYLRTDQDGRLYFRMQGTGGGGHVDLDNTHFTNTTRIDFNGWFEV